MSTAIQPNTLFFGDNLPILRDYIPTESIDLVYLDPPFNSNRSYNVLFADESGRASEAQLTAFDDTWHWGPTAEQEYYELTINAPLDVAKMIGAMRELIGSNQMMAYLVMMTARLVELHRVLKPTGSLYLHCDPTASHYLKVILDTVFGNENFRNEIIWKRQSAHSDAKYKFPDVADIILFYSKSRDLTFAPQYSEHDPIYLQNFYRFDDQDGRGQYALDNMASPNPRPNMMYDWLGFPCPVKGWRYQKETMQKLHDDGRIWYPKTASGEFDYTRRPRLKRYLGEQEGSIITNIWNDIQPISSQAAERLGYPTQKPLALLERIIQASSNPGDVVLDPFCGCGTAIAAAEKLDRRWIGIDITHLAISLIRYRMHKMFPECQFSVIGEPLDLAGAQKLAKDNRYQFQWWALSLVEARPVGGEPGSKRGKKGMDRGIDGMITFLDDPKGKLSTVVVQVKSGRVKSGDVRDLAGVIGRENAALGVFITLEPPTSEMQTEAVKAGFYHSKLFDQDYPRLQIFTIDELLKGAKVQMPPSEKGTLKAAERVKKREGRQGELGI